MNPKVEKTPVGVLVGRFQTNELHDAHLKLIQFVVDNHPRVLVFLGLSPLKVTINNPLDFEARKQMLLDAFGDKITVLYIKDVNNDELWSKTLDKQINDVIGPNQTVTLYGGRDSFANHYTGKYKTVELESDTIISASEIRKKISAKVKSSPDFRAGVIWASQNQYPKVYPTVDIAIVKDNKVLLARKPDETKYRFVGGFVDPKDDSYEFAAKREAAEETGLEVGNVKYLGSKKIDDWRYRNEKDKIITHFYLAHYTFGSPQANDDVCELKWFEIGPNDDHIVDEHKALWEILRFVKVDKDKQ